MLYTINQLYDHLYQKTHEVYDVFKNFFGEQYVDFHPHYTDPFFKRVIGRHLQELDIEPIDYKDYNLPYELSSSVLKSLERSLQNYRVDIYVWWPYVTVTNEHGRSIHIRDLYAEIEIQLDGRIPYEYPGFMLNRATYTRDQFLSDYLFSHIQQIPKSNLATFMNPCLGTGPIKDTIGTLKCDGNEVTWMLFCQELSMYVTVESLEGGPWKRLENVGGYVQMSSYTGYDYQQKKNHFFHIFKSHGDLEDFIRYYLEKGHLSLSYRDGKFCCGMPYYEYIIDISNAFIDFFNDYFKDCSKEDRKRIIKCCFNHSLLFHTIAANGRFYKYNPNRKEDNTDLTPFQNRRVLTFKGVEILSHITEERDNVVDDTTVTTILSHSFAMYILHHILRTINFRYRNEYYYNKYDHLKNAPNYQRVCYL